MDVRGLVIGLLIGGGLGFGGAYFFWVKPQQEKIERLEKADPNNLGNALGGAIKEALSPENVKKMNEALKEAMGKFKDIDLDQVKKELEKVSNQIKEKAKNMEGESKEKQGEK